MKLLKIKTIVVVFTLMWLASCSGIQSLTPAEKYAQTHKNNNFWDRINGMDDRKLKDIKEEYKDVQASLKKEKKQDKTQAKIGEFREKIRELKKDN